MRRMSPFVPLFMVLACVMIGCESGRSGATKPKAAEPVVATPAVGAGLKPDPLVGRWRLDTAESVAGGDPPMAPEEVLGETIIIMRNGGFHIADSPRRGKWKRVPEGVRITLDAPPTALDARFEVSVTDTEMRLRGPSSWRLVYRRDTLLAPRATDEPSR